MVERKEVIIEIQVIYFLDNLIEQLYILTTFLIKKTQNFTLRKFMVL